MIIDQMSWSSCLAKEEYRSGDVTIEYIFGVIKKSNCYEFGKTSSIFIKIIGRKKLSINSFSDSEEILNMINKSKSFNIC